MRAISVHLFPNLSCASSKASSSSLVHSCSLISFVRCPVYLRRHCFAVLGSSHAPLSFIIVAIAFHLFAPCLAMISLSFSSSLVVHGIARGALERPRRGRFSPRRTRNSPNEADDGVTTGVAFEAQRSRARRRRGHGVGKSTTARSPRATSPSGARVTRNGVRANEGTKLVLSAYE